MPGIDLGPITHSVLRVFEKALSYLIGFVIRIELIPAAAHGLTQLREEVDKSTHYRRCVIGWLSLCFFLFWADVSSVV